MSDTSVSSDKVKGSRSGAFPTKRDEPKAVKPAKAAKVEQASEPAKAAKVEQSTKPVKPVKSDADMFCPYSHTCKNEKCTRRHGSFPPMPKLDKPGHYSWLEWATHCCERDEQGLQPDQILGTPNFNLTEVRARIALDKAIQAAADSAPPVNMNDPMIQSYLDAGTDSVRERLATTFPEVATFIQQREAYLAWVKTLNVPKTPEQQIDALTQQVAVLTQQVEVLTNRMNDLISTLGVFTTLLSTPERNLHKELELAMEAVAKAKAEAEAAQDNGDA